MNVVVCLASPDRWTPAEQTALACALRLAPDAVTAVSVGAAGGAPALAQALAAGAARAVLAVDEALPKSGPLGVGRALAHAVRHVGGQVALLGVGADEDGLNLLPAAVAHHLEAIVITSVDTVAADTDDSVVVTTPSAGRLRRLRVPFPCVLGVCAGAAVAAPPAATGRSIEVISLATLGLNPALLPRSTDWLGRAVSNDGKPKTLSGPADLKAALR